MVKKFTFDDEDDDFAYDNDLKEQNNDYHDDLNSDLHNDFDDHLHDTSHEDPKETEYINSHSTQNKSTSKKQKRKLNIIQKSLKKKRNIRFFQNSFYSYLLSLLL